MNKRIMKKKYRNAKSLLDVMAETDDIFAAALFWEDVDQPHGLSHPMTYTKRLSKKWL